MKAWTITWTVCGKTHRDVVVGEPDENGACALYTREEWEYESSADFELNEDGEFLFQGQPFGGSVRARKQIPGWAK